MKNSFKDIWFTKDVLIEILPSFYKGLILACAFYIPAKSLPQPFNLPFRQVFSEHWIIHSILLFHAFIALVFGFWFLFTFRKQPKETTSSRIYNVLRKWNISVNRLTFFAIGLALFPFIFDIVLSLIFESQPINTNSLRLAFYLFFFSFFAYYDFVVNSMTRNTSSDYGFVIFFGIGKIFFSILVYLLQVEHFLSIAIEKQ